MTRSSKIWIYGVLIAVWAVLIGWQIAEHLRVRKLARERLVLRAKDISNTLALVLRSQRRFGGLASKERLESALNELVKPGEVNSLALLNAGGETVVAAGAPVKVPTKKRSESGAFWEEDRLTFASIIDLGANVTGDTMWTNPTIVIPRFGPPQTGEFSFPTPQAGGRTSSEDSSQTNRFRPPPRPESEDGRSPRISRDSRTPLGRPPWLSEEEFNLILQKQGIHSFLIVMSAEPYWAACRQDLWLRSIIGILATISVVGSALAWRNLSRSSDLQIRLVRASELNARLEEMNLAAAGLAHETKNPLNIIRGLAQMISKQQDATPEIRQNSCDIIHETDRVTAQLNEFINYSRPRELRRRPVAVQNVIGDVVRALTHDLEEKQIKLHKMVEPITVEADEQMLRQTLFNLLINAIQAVFTGGEIQVIAGKTKELKAYIEIRDNGPGVSPENRSEIFKPYFTTRMEGTGLGLAVVQHIVLAHGWEIECLPNEPAGAVFRLNHLKMVGPS